MSDRRTRSVHRLAALGAALLALFCYSAPVSQAGTMHGGGGDSVGSIPLRLEMLVFDGVYVGASTDRADVEAMLDLLMERASNQSPAPAGGIDPNGSLLSSSVSGPAGTVHVVTPRRVGESIGNQVWRHRIAVDRAGIASNGSVDGSPLGTAASTSPTTLTASWTSANGVTHTVSTPQKDDEGPVDHAQRHGAAVEALMAVFPPEAVLHGSNQGAGGELERPRGRARAA